MKYKVLLFRGGRMGELAQNVLEQHDNVELTTITGKVDVVMGEFDIVFSASYPNKILPEWCAKGKLGAMNIHTGLLPEGRGSHPLNWALIWGKEKTGITIHKITQTYDAGTIYAQHEIPIFDTDNIVSLRQRVEDAFPMVIARFFDDPLNYVAQGYEQNQAHASYAQKRLPEDGLVNMRATEIEIYNFIRAHDPENYPAFTYMNGEKVNIKGARFEKGEVIIDL